MQAIHEIAELPQRMIYSVAAQIIVVDAQDSWAAGVIEKLFKGWYLTRETTPQELPPGPDIVISSQVEPPEIPRHWPEFEIAGSGTCFTDGTISYIDIEGSIVAVGARNNTLPTVEVWTNGMLDIQSARLTRVVTYALSAALRRRTLFELHSGAVVDPDSGRGVLIIGPSGSGKSTLTVQLAAAGWPFLTDDVLLLNADGVAVKAWPLRRCFAITSETFAANHFLRSHAALDYIHTGDKKNDKSQFYPHDVFNSQFREQCLPKTLFFSQLGGGEHSSVLQLSAAETMSRLIRISPWSCYDRSTAAKHLEVLCSLVKQSTGYALLAGMDLLEPGVSAKLIANYTRD